MGCFQWFFREISAKQTYFASSILHCNGVSSPSMSASHQQTSILWQALDIRVTTHLLKQDISTSVCIWTFPGVGQATWYGSSGWDTEQYAIQWGRGCCFPAQNITQGCSVTGLINNWQQSNGSSADPFFPFFLLSGPTLQSGIGGKNKKVTVWVPTCPTTWRWWGSHKEVVFIAICADRGRWLAMGGCGGRRGLQRQDPSIR